MGKERDALGAKRTDAKTRGTPWCLVELPPLLSARAKWAGVSPAGLAASSLLGVWDLCLSGSGLMVKEPSRPQFLWKCCSLSRVQLLATPWTVARQAPWPVEFSRQEYWSGLPFATLGDLPDSGMEPVSLASLALAARFFSSRVISMSKKTGFPKWTSVSLPKLIFCGFLIWHPLINEKHFRKDLFFRAGSSKVWTYSLRPHLLNLLETHLSFL